MRIFLNSEMLVSSQFGKEFHYHIWFPSSLFALIFPLNSVALQLCSTVEFITEQLLTLGSLAIHRSVRVFGDSVDFVGSSTVWFVSISLVLHKFFSTKGRITGPNRLLVGLSPIAGLTGCEEKGAPRIPKT